MLTILFNQSVPVTTEIIYYGTLFQWDGSSWVKSPLQTEISSDWATVGLYCRIEGEWKLVNTTGV